MDRKILVGYDDSDQAKDALALGRQPAAATGAELIVAGVFPFDSMWAGLHEQLAKAWSTVPDGVEVEATLISGDAVEALVNVAGTPGTLLAVGSRAYGPLMLCYDGSDNAQRAIGVAGALFGPRPALVLHFWDCWVADAPAFADVSRSVAGMAAELDEIADQQPSGLNDDGVEHAEQSGFVVQPGENE